METDEKARILIEQYKISRSRTARQIIREKAKHLLPTPMYVDFLDMCIKHHNNMANCCEICDK